MPDPTTAREQWDCDRDLGFLDTGVFAEAVTYDSPRDSISGRSVSAVVIDAADTGSTKGYEVWISDDATSGVAAPRNGATFTTAGGDVLRIQGSELDEGMHRCVCVAVQEGG